MSHIDSGLWRSVLVLAPHTDDGEFGCGGTIAKLVEEAKDVYYVAFSDCEKSIKETGLDLPHNILAEELTKATRQLGILESRVKIEAFEVRLFERDRQEILERLVELEREIGPDLVLLPSPHDLHQDHQTIALEGLRAFKRSSTILGYEMPWNNLTFGTTAFVRLGERHIQKKVDALKCYESQKDRYYASERFVRSLAIARGVQVGVEYAEAFEVLRLII